MIKTKDMYLAAALVSYGSAVTKVEKENIKEQWFCFDEVPGKVFCLNGNDLPESALVTDFQGFRSLYLSKKLFLPPTFVDCLKSVKAYLYNTE